MLPALAMGAIQLLLNTRRNDVIELLESRTDHEVAARAARSGFCTSQWGGLW